MPKIQRKPNVKTHTVVCIATAPSDAYNVCFCLAEHVGDKQKDVGTQSISFFLPEQLLSGPIKLSGYLIHRINCTQETF